MTASRFAGHFAPANRGLGNVLVILLVMSLMMTNLTGHAIRGWAGGHSDCIDEQVAALSRPRIPSVKGLRRSITSNGNLQEVRMRALASVNRPAH